MHQAQTSTRQHQQLVNCVIEQCGQGYSAIGAHEFRKNVDQSNIDIAPEATHILENGNLSAYSANTQSNACDVPQSI